MATKTHNITNAITTELVAPGENARISSMSVTNVGGDLPCVVDIFIEKLNVGKFYFSKGEYVYGSKVFNVNFDNGSGQFGLYVKLTGVGGTTPKADIILM